MMARFAAPASDCIGVIGLGVLLWFGCRCCGMITVMCPERVRSRRLAQMTAKCVPSFTSFCASIGCVCCHPKERGSSRREQSLSHW